MFVMHLTIKIYQFTEQEKKKKKKHQQIKAERHLNLFSNDEIKVFPFEVKQ